MTQPLQAATPRPAPEAPYYLPVGNEVELFLAAYRARMPVLLKGPTGCGKTRFLEHMTHRLYRGSEAGTRAGIETSLVTVACHEDLTATDLVGRYLLEGDDTVWMDGPLTRAVRDGSICYLDEIVEARKDTTVLIHALTDHRRILPIEKRRGFDEGVSTRLLIYTAQLIDGGVGVREACTAAICRAITDDDEVQRAVTEVATTLLP